MNTGGIMPGSFSGARPVEKGPNELSKDDVRKMDAKTLRERMKDPQFVERLTRLYQS